jgi:hypothetical protein
LPPPWRRRSIDRVGGQPISEIRIDAHGGVQAVMRAITAEVAAARAWLARQHSGDAAGAPA